MTDFQLDLIFAHSNVANVARKSRERHVKQAIPHIALGLAQGKSNVEVAKECGVGEATVRRLLKDNEFADRLQHITQQMMESLEGRDYKKVPVKDIAYSLDKLIDKTQLKRGQPTEIVNGLDGIRIAIFGPGSTPTPAGSKEIGNGGVREAMGAIDAGPEEPDRPGNLGGDDK